ncbi:helix-turn-helix domain-containing protein [Natranaerobius thermophilus]|uniref:Transcriptional regulator, XRE family n=1 Tax=Natranaerobius thermophilus (strain ATCC BAA-1301 / DSM 18059 / JW/NM-WN-LF) TaxID=457570 RepID=B2A1Q4_NATTJ|nr:helix-turn-helix transcriptional regulator [Natranaerobius thermophilus]ACB86101.1 transcriptional regulator, XRE family [Natranaerobius thermophilus JW/NM-WN-LF]
MKKLSTEKLAETVKFKRNENNLTQEELSEQTGINRVMIGRIEKQDFIPSINQLEKLADALEFEITDLLVESDETSSFTAMRREALGENEIEGVETLITMMLSLRQQKVLRSKFKNV